MNDKRAIVNVESSKDCTKEEILNYAEFLNKKHHKIMNNKIFESPNSAILRCWNCKHAMKISKGNITCGGTQTYIIVCKKENICFQINWNELIIPCSGSLNKKEVKDNE